MKRQFIIFIIALAASLGSLVAAWATITEQNQRLRGYVNPTQSADLPYIVPRLGVNAELTQYTQDELDEHFALMSQAHIHWVRQYLRWDEIQPDNADTYQWAAWDTIVETIANYPNLELVAVIVNSPEWARPSNPDQPTSPPNHPDTLATFATAFAQRYGKTIHYYQIWDEPNLTAAWGNQAPRPAAYLALLTAAYNAIHSADASATVISAALAPTTEQGPDNISDLRYLSDLYALGAHDVMDVVAAKPYGFDHPANDYTVSQDTLNFSRIVALREIMQQNGDGKKSLWASQWGWNSLPENWTGTPSIWGNTSADDQVAYTHDALTRAEHEFPWLGGMILHHWQPQAPADDPVWGFALVDQDTQPTALLNSLIAREPTPYATNGIYPPTTPYARYSGVWTFGKLGADIGWAQDSELAFDFIGTELALLLRQDDYVAYLYPTIDGYPANALPQDTEGNAYVILTSPDLQPHLDLVPLAHDLADAPHTLHITTDRGYDRWALAGYAVSAGDLAAPYQRQTAIALFTAAIALIATIASAHAVDWRKILHPIRKIWTPLSQTTQFIITIITTIALLIGMLITWQDATPNILRREPVQLGIAIATAGILYLAPAFILVIISALILFIIFYHRTDFALALIIFYAPFFLFPVELYKYAFPMSELLILIAFGAWLLKQGVKWGIAHQTTTAQYRPSLPNLRFHALDLGVIAWVIIGVLSLMWSQHRAQALTELRTMIIEPALFYLMLRTTPLDRRQLLRLVDALLLAGAVVAVVGLFQYLQGENIITAEAGAKRLASVYGSPNNAALLLGRAIPFALAFMLTPQDRVRRMIAAALLIVMLIAAALTLSAGALFIGIPAAIAAVLVMIWGKRAWKALAGLGGIGAIIFAIALQSARFARVLDFSEGTNFYRIRLWQSTLNILRDHPITGLGLDQFLYAYRGHYIMPDAWQEPNLSHPHNILLDFWTRLGIFGVITLIAIQIAFWKNAIALYHRFRKDALIFAIIIGAMGSMVNLITHGLIDNSVYVNDLALIFVFLLGIIATLSSTKPAADSNPPA